MVRKHKSSSVKHGRGSVLAWSSVAAYGTGPVIFIDYVCDDGRSRINSE